MEYEKPSKKGFTIYTKSGCPGCLKVKTLLKERNPRIIDCDEFLLDDRDNFKTFISNLTRAKKTVFPFVFYEGKYIGGYEETCDVYNNIGIDLDEIFQHE